MAMRKTLDDSTQLNPQVAQPLRSVNTGFDGQIEAQKANIESISSLNNTINDFADKQAVMAGSNAGLEAGMKPDFRSLRGTSLYAQAFNRAGAQSYQSQVEASATQSIQRIFDENRGNPKTFNEQLESYRTGFEESLQPKEKLIFRDVFSRRAMAYQERAQDEYERSSIDNLAANNLAAMQAQLSSVSAIARNVKDDATALSSYANERDMLAAKVIESLPREGGLFDGKQVPPDPTRLPVYTFQKGQEILQKFDEAFITERVLGKFDKSYDKQAFAKSLENEVKAINPAVYTPELRDRIETKINSALSEDRQRQSQNRSAYVSVAKQAEERTMRGEAVPQEIANAVDITAAAASDDPSVLSDYQSLKTRMDKVPIYRTATQSQLDDRLNTLNQKAASEGLHPFEEEERKLVQNIRDDNAKELSGGFPMNLAIKRGITQNNPLVVQDDKGNFSVSPETIQSKVQASYELNKLYGTHGFLTSDQAANLTNSMKGMTTRQQVSVMSGIATQVPDEIRPQIAKELSMKDPSVGAAMSLLGDDDRVAMQIIDGEKIEYKLPGDLDAQIDANMTGLINNTESMNIAKAAVKANYKYYAAKGALDPTALTNGKVLTGAIQDVVGHVIERNAPAAGLSAIFRNPLGIGGSKNKLLSYRHNGQWVDETEFDNVLEDAAKYGDQFVQDALGTKFMNGGKTETYSMKRIMQEATFDTYGNGVYMLKKGSDYLVDDRGQPALLDMRKLHSAVEEKRKGVASKGSKMISKDTPSGIVIGE